MSEIEEKAVQQVLIVDDDTYMLDFLSTLLTADNFDPVCCETAGDAEKVFDAYNFKVAILDLELPDSTGLDLLRKLKQKNPALKAIIHTGFATIDAAINAVNEEAFSFLKKPSDPKEIISSVHKAFNAYYARYNKELKEEILRRKQIEQNQKETIQELQFFDDINTAHVSGKPFDKILEIICENFKQLCNAPSTAIYLYNRKRKVLVQEYSGLNRSIREKIEKHADIKIKDYAPLLKEGSVFRQTLETGKSRVFTDPKIIGELLSEFSDNPELEKFTPKIMQFLDLKSFGIIPLKTSRNIVGMITFFLQNEDSEPLLYKKLDRVARQISVSLEKIQQDLELQNQAQILKEKERRYALATQAGKVGVWDWHVKANKVYTDGNLKEAIGYSEKEIDDSLPGWLNLIHPDDISKMKDTIKHHLKSKTHHYEVTHRMLCKDGGLRWFLARGTAIFNGDGVADRIVGTETDITERVLIKQALKKAHDDLEKRVEERTVQLQQTNMFLKESQQKYHSLFSDAQDMISIMDADYRIMEANESELQTLGYSREEYIGRYYLSLIHPEYQERTQSFFKSVLEGAEKKSFETCMVSKNKENVFVEVLLTTQRAKGMVDCIRSIARNITDRITAEKEMLEFSEDERRRIGAELHDGLGQDLTGIAFKAKALENKLKNIPKNEHKELGHIINLVNTTISKTRFLAKGLYPVRLSADGFKNALTELVENTQKVFDVACDFTCNTQADFPPEKAIHLYRICQEAISNAIKHGKAQKIDVVFTNQKKQLILTIVDDGTGFSEDTKKSSGLGLFIMRNRAKVIGASFDHVQQSNGGTRVTCILKK